VAAVSAATHSWRVPFLLPLFSLLTTTASAQPLAYLLTQGPPVLGCGPIAGGGSTDLIVINEATGHTVARLPTAASGAGEYDDIVVLPGGQRAYVTNETEVLVVDLATNSIGSRIVAGMLVGVAGFGILKMGGFIKFLGLFLVGAAFGMLASGFRLV